MKKELTYLSWGECNLVISKVALIYDWENRWALEEAEGFAKNNKRYEETCVEYYKALWKRGIAVDIINAHGDFEKYDLVIVPMLYMTGLDTIRKITKYVENGGTVYATYMLGMVNENDLCYLGGYPAEGLKQVFGIWNEEIDTLYPGEKVKVISGEEHYDGVEYSELIHAKEASVLATFASEFYVGMPAATVHSYGKGKAYYQAFRDTGAFWEKMITTILDELNIRPTLPGGLPEGVCAHKREADGVEYIFVQNYSEYAVKDIDLGNEYLDIESGEVLNKVSLDAFDVKCLKR